MNYADSEEHRVDGRRFTAELCEGVEYRVTCVREFTFAFKSLYPRKCSSLLNDRVVSVAEEVDDGGVDMVDEETFPIILNLNLILS